MIDKGSRVAVLMGGMSAERGVSLKSGAAVSGALKSRGWDVVEIDVGRDLPARLVESGAEVCFLALHGRYGEDGCVQGLLEVMGLPYTGSGVRASAVAMDKIATKRALAGVPGLRMAKDEVVREVGAPPFLPCVVKAPTGGSTIGVWIVKSEAEYRDAVAAALRTDPWVLIEELLVGEEITVAVIDGEALPVVRIVPKSGFFDYEAKYTKGMTTYEVPAAIPDVAARSAQDAAVAAYRGLGCEGLCRADFMVPPGGEPVFLEINTIPGMTATSLSPMAAGHTGVSFEDLVERILLSAKVASSG